MLRGFFLILFLIVVAAAQVPPGATKKEVIEKLGWPKSTSGSAEREIMNYPEFSVFLVDGKVVNLRSKPKDKKLPNTYTPRPTKTAPRPAPKTAPAPAHLRQAPTPAPIPPAPAQTPELSEPAKNISAVPPAPLKADQTQPMRPPPVVPRRPAPSTGVGSMLLWMGLFLGVILVLKLVAYTTKRRMAEDTQFFGADNTPAPPLLRPQGARQGMSVKPDPLTAGWSLALLKEIEWHRFEQVVAAYERELGNDAELTSFGADDGIDVEVFENGSRTPKRVIQCKAFDNQKVGVELVRAFYGAMTLQKVPHGVFYTTSTFTEDALAIGRANSNLELVDGPTFLNRIDRLQLSAQLRLFETATEGDYTTPTCPSCGVKMQRRTARKGRSAGRDFWACATPRCGHTLNMTAND